MRQVQTRDGPGLGVALRRVVVGYRVVGAAWLTALAVVAIVTDDAEATVTALTIAAVWGWTLATAGAASRPGMLRSRWWLVADVALSAWTILSPSAAGAARLAFYGGYPFSSVLLATYARGLGGGGVAAAVLAVVSVVRLRLVGSGALPDVLASVLVYLLGAAVVAWGIGVIRRNDAERRAFEAALAEERAERARSEERAATAAHLHDSVLQTLALIQRRADDPAAVGQLARRQERELRAWLYPGQARNAQRSFAAAIKEAAAAVEDLHGITVEAVAVGDVELDAGTEAVVAAAREALVNVAKHAGVAQASLFAEATPAVVTVFVRDRGAGFDPDGVPADRRGIADSIVTRLERVGGTARLRSVVGEGTEVELSLPTGDDRS